MLFSNKNHAQTYRLRNISLLINAQSIHVEVAKSAADREMGLMYRLELAPNHGMLFVFDTVDFHCFWMRKTFIPLSIAFITQAGKIVNIEDMQPQTSIPHCSLQPVRYALEVNQGWFTQHHVPINTVINGLP